MLKINRIGAIAFGLAVGIGIFMSVVYFLDYQQRQADDRISAANDYLTTSNERPESCGAIMSEGSFFDWLACFGDSVTAPESQKAAEYDLKAQQDMAAWALGMLIITFWLTVITLGGVLFVWRTLKATQEMAQDTRSMAKDAREIGEAQTRAYIDVTDVEISWPNCINKRPTITVHYCNSGQTPARELQVVYSMLYTPYGLSAKAFFDESHLSPRSNLGSKGKRSLEINKISNSIEDYRGPLLRDEISFQAAGIIKYYDVFGRRHFTTFRYLTLRKSEGQMRITPSPRGNRSG